MLPLGDWRFRLDPRDEWRQMFIEAWRLERDYFYDRQMHGVDWTAIRAKYVPLVERVTDRAELTDLLAQMVGELSALHIFVRGGDMRKGTDDVATRRRSGRDLARDASGRRLPRRRTSTRSDPDLPDELSPLAAPGVDVKDGDVITQINGVPDRRVAELGQLLRDQAGKQVLLA